MLLEAVRIAFRCAQVHEGGARLGARRAETTPPQSTMRNYYIHHEDEPAYMLAVECTLINWDPIT